MVTEVANQVQAVNSANQDLGVKRDSGKHLLQAFFPLKPGSKEPMVKAWQVVVPGQFQAVGNYGINLPSEILVLDADPRNYPPGRDVLNEILRTFNVPGTRIVATPRGGRHVYLRKPPELKFSKDQSRYPGIDFLSQGQYVVGPGSTTIASENSAAGTYEIIADADIADAPVELLDALERSSEANMQGSDYTLSGSDNFKIFCSVYPAASIGSRDSSAIKFADQGGDLGLPQNAVYEMLRDFWNPRCQPPLSEGKLLQNVEHAYRYRKNAIGCNAPESVFTRDMAAPPIMVPTLQAKYLQEAEAGFTAKPGKKSPQRNHILFCSRAAVLWHDSDSTAYATVTVNNRKENHKVRSRGFRLWLLREFRNEYGGAPGSSAIEEALSTIEANAIFDGERFETAMRVAQHKDKMYLDLCNEQWQVVEIDSSGWKVIEDSPVKFTRNSGMRSLPSPAKAKSDSLVRLRKLLHVTDDHAWVLLKSFLVACLRSGSPCPVLFLTGEQGSGKTTIGQAIRKLIDPHELLLRGALREEREVLVALKRGYVIGFDNLSTLSREHADTLCRISSGGGNGFRQLYTDDDEVIFAVIRPIIITAIGDVAGSYDDLLSRSVLVHLDPMADNLRMTDDDFWREFDAIHSEVLGALLQAVSGALYNLPSTKLDQLPRLADFAKWSTAAEPYLEMRQGEFIEAFTANRRRASEQALETSPLAQLILTLPLPWSGTADNLLKMLRLSPSAHANSLPRNATSLGNAIRRVEPALREVGFRIRHTRNSAQRTIEISREV